MANSKKTLAERMVILETKFDTISKDVKDIKKEIEKWIEKMETKLSDSNKINGNQNVNIERIKEKADTNRKFIWSILFLLAGIIVKSFIK